MASWGAAFIFIPSAVGVIEYGDIMSKFGVSILLVVVISTFVVMVSTGTLTQLIAKRKERKIRVHRNYKFVFNGFGVYGGKKVYARHPKVYTSPLLVTPAVLVGLLLLVNVPYETYNLGGEMLTDMLQPATVAFAIPLYKYFPILKNTPLKSF